MNFKAHMTLLSWRELLEWMARRGDEAAMLLNQTCVDLNGADRRSYNQLMQDEVFWDRTVPADRGMLELILSGCNFNGQDVQFSFFVKEEDWFSHAPLTIQMFKTIG